MNKHSLSKGSALQKSLFTAALLCFALTAFSSLQAQRRSKAQGKTRAAAGLRLASFSTLGDLNKQLPSGIGFQLYYQHPLSGLPVLSAIKSKAAYVPRSLELVLNYESLSNTEKEVKNRGLDVKYSLNRVGLEAGPRWFFPFSASQGLAVSWLLGFAQEKNSVSSRVPADKKDESSGLVFSTHLLLNYEYQYSDLIFAVGSYTVYGADKELPLTATGLNLGFGYKF